MGRVLLSRTNNTSSYEITAWADPITQTFCHYRSGPNQTCAPAELYNFSFRCGSAGNVHNSDLYLVSSKAREWGAYRAGDHIVLNAGQTRVRTSHAYGDCFGRGLSLTQTSRCIETSDKYRTNQILIHFPPNRAPLAADARLNNRAIGDDCGNGRFCEIGSKCSAGSGFVPANSVDCGNGRSCTAGSKCSLGGGCVPANAVDCGGGKSCPTGNSCGVNGVCIKPVPRIAEVGNPTPSGGSWSPSEVFDTKIEMDAKTKALLFVVFVLFSYIKYRSGSLSPRIKFAFGVVEAAVSIYFGKGDSVTIAEGLIVALPFGIDIVAQLVAKPHSGS